MWKKKEQGIKKKLKNYLIQQHYDEGTIEDLLMVRFTFTFGLFPTSYSMKRIYYLLVNHIVVGIFCINISWFFSFTFYLIKEKNEKETETNS